MEGDNCKTSVSRPFFKFQSTPSAWRETGLRNPRFTESLYFNPLPPHGGRHCQRYFVGTLRSFQSTPSAWRETYAGIAKAINATISIHSLRMEGDCQRNFACIVIDQFQSTPSAWRETRFRFRRNINGLYFNPLPPHGGRLFFRPFRWHCQIISIHSLRMEGDDAPKPEKRTRRNFNPLPPHGGRHP